MVLDPAATSDGPRAPSCRPLVAFHQSSRALRHAALTDGLTALPNRRLLRDRLQQAVLMHAGTASPSAS